MMEAGAEKLRYVTGYAVAINSKGKRASISLDRSVGSKGERKLPASAVEIANPLHEET